MQDSKKKNTSMKIFYYFNEEKSKLLINDCILKYINIHFINSINFLPKSYFNLTKILDRSQLTNILKKRSEKELEFEEINFFINTNIIF